MRTVQKIITIGGSAGSLPVLLHLLENLPGTFSIPVVVILHRLKNVSSDLQRILAASQRHLRVKEPEDKEAIKERHIYIAPQNYHLLVEADHTLSLDYSEAVHYSRPSIDVTFESMVRVYGAGTIAVLLSGANHDGAEGVEKIIEAKGTAIVQDPATCEYPVMPAAAIARSHLVQILSPNEIIRFFNQLQSD